MKAYKEISDEMSELGYECTEELVKAVHEHHKNNPLPHDAALAGNILAALQARNIKIEA